MHKNHRMEDIFRFDSTTLNYNYTEYTCNQFQSKKKSKQIIARLLHLYKLLKYKILLAWKFSNKSFNMLYTSNNEWMSML